MHEEYKAAYGSDPLQDLKSLAGQTFPQIGVRWALSDAQPTDVAGRPAYSVSASPKHDGGLLGSVQLAWDAEQGVPLGAGIYAQGSSTPVLALTVKDTGVGIPAGELPRLFERFHRVAGTRARAYEGSCIGLALVNDLVRLHGGRVEVASEVGAGTTFTVVLPTGHHHLV